MANMNLLTLSVILGAILAVQGQDPTAVCYPPVFQTRYINMINDDTGVIYVDFGKQKFTEISAVTGSQYIHDFTNLKSYAITGSGNSTTCKSYKLQQSQVMYRCLPPFAKKVNTASGILNYIVAVRVNIQTWDVYTDSDEVNRVTFSVVSGQPYWPILSQQYGYHGTKSLYLYLNPDVAISNQNVFTIPENCTTHNIDIKPVIG